MSLIQPFKHININSMLMLIIFITFPFNKPETETNSVTVKEIHSIFYKPHIIVGDTNAKIITFSIHLFVQIQKDCLSYIISFDNIICFHLLFTI